MKHRFLCLLPLLALCGDLLAVPLVVDDPVLASNAVIRLEAGKGRPFAFRPVAVEPGRCYRLVFEGRVEGGHTLENTPRVDIARFERSRLFWRWGIRQAGAMNGFGSTVSTTPMTLFSSAWRRYDDLFRADERASTASLSFTPPVLPVTLELRNLRLEPYDNGKAANLNGDFSLGAENLAGWNNPNDAAGFRTVKGRRVFDTAYGSESMPFPVDDATAYRVALKRTTYGGYTACNLYFRDAKGKGLKLITVRDGTFDFVPPAGAVEAYFKIYNTYLESVVVTPLGPKEMLR